MSLSNLQQELKHILLKEPAYKTESLKAMLEQLAWFAGTQIRNAACLGGNICTASPISDLNPVLIAAVSKRKKRIIHIPFNAKIKVISNS